ncbi:MAG: MFS transporter [Coriobacteriales bacterium]|nr:MFS transporter [Coriobacteriales bacterium]
MANGSKTSIKIGIYMSAVLVMGIIAISSDLANICAAFPQYDPNLVITLMISSAAVIQIPVNLLTGKLVERFTKRNLMLTATLVWLIAGNLPYWLTNIWLIFICRLFFGVGCGMAQVLCAALVVQYFKDPAERDKVMGTQVAFQCAGGIIFALLCGWLSGFGWNVAFLTHLVGIPSLIICIFCVPNEKPAKALVKDKSQKPKFKPTALMWIWVIGFTLFVVGSQSLGNYTASAVEDMGLGGAQMAATVMMCYSAGGLIAGFLFGKIAAALKDKTFLVGCALFGIGYLTIGLVGSTIACCIGAVISGSLYSVCMSCSINGAANAVEQDSSEMATSLVAGGLNLGATLNPIILGPIAAALSGSIGIFSMSQLAFGIAGALIIVVGIALTLVTSRASRNKA